MTPSTDEGLQTATAPPVVWTLTLSLREINNFKVRTVVIRVTYNFTKPLCIAAVFCPVHSQTFMCWCSVVTQNLWLSGHHSAATPPDKWWGAHGGMGGGDLPAIKTMEVKIVRS